MRATLPSVSGAVDQVLDDHADALYDFALAMTRSRAAAVELVREAVPPAVAEYGAAVTRAALLGGVFDVAMTRMEPPGTLSDELLKAGEGTHEELRRVCQEAVRALEPRHRGILDLTLRQGLHGEQLGEALRVSPGQVSAATKSALQEAEYVVGSVLLSRVGQDDCPGLAAVLEVLPADRDGTLIAAEVISHQAACPACDDRRRALVPVASLLAGIPPTTAPPELRQAARPKLRTVAAPTAPAERLSPRRQRTARVLAVAAFLLLAASSATAVLRRDRGPEPAPLTPTPTLRLSVTELDFSKNVNEATFEVANPSRRPQPFTLGTEAPWLSVTVPTETLPPRGRATVVARLDRSRAPEGQILAEIRTGRPAGVAPVAVRAEVDRAPSISKVELTPRSVIAGPCPGSAAAQARVSLVEESGIDVARVHWREPKGAERSSVLTRADDGTFTGPLGPVARAGEVIWWVVAVDTRGNTTVSAPANLAVTGC